MSPTFTGYREQHQSLVPVEGINLS